jgi:hypothetical protein
MVRPPLAVKALVLPGRAQPMVEVACQASLGFLLQVQQMCQTGIIRILLSNWRIKVAELLHLPTVARTKGPGNGKRGWSARRAIVTIWHRPEASIKGTVHRMG